MPFSLFFCTDSLGHTSCVSNMPCPGGSFFAEPQQGDSPSADGRNVAAPAAGAKRKGHLRFPFLFELLPFPCLLARRRLPTCDRCEIRERQRIFSTVSFSTCSQCQIPYCYTGRLLLASATCPCRATGTHVITHGTCECRRSAAFILVGPVCNNAPKNCAALSCRALRI